MSDPIEGVWCLTSGSAFDALKPKQRRDYELVKAAVLADRGFSAFDASSTAALARMFDRLCADPDIVTDNGSAYPWVGVSHASEKESA